MRLVVEYRNTGPGALDRRNGRLGGRPFSMLFVFRHLGSVPAESLEDALFLLRPTFLEISSRVRRRALRA